VAAGASTATNVQQDGNDNNTAASIAMATDNKEGQ